MILGFILALAGTIRVLIGMSKSTVNNNFIYDPFQWLWAGGVIIGIIGVIIFIANEKK